MLQFIIIVQIALIKIFIKLAPAEVTFKSLITFPNDLRGQNDFVYVKNLTAISLHV